MSNKTTREQYREWLTSTGEHEGRQLSDWAVRLVASFGLEGAVDLLSVTGDSSLYGVDLRRSPWAGRAWLRDLVRTARETDLELSRALYKIANDRSWMPDEPTPRVGDAREALAYVEQGIYANEGNASSVVWPNDEVLDVLRDIRSLLLTGVMPA